MNTINEINDNESSVTPANVYKIATNDGKVFNVLGQILVLSDLINDTICCCGGDEIVPLPNIDSTTFKHILKLFKMWADDPQPYVKPSHGGKGMGPDSDSPEFTYLHTLSRDELYSICRAGGYLLSQRLTDTTVFFIHHLTQNMDAKELCNFFGETYDPKRIPKYLDKHKKTNNS